MNETTLLQNIVRLSARFVEERSERQLRRCLDRSDFDGLREAGYPLVGLPTDRGGLWKNVVESTRPICETLRTLARGDSSVALVAAMHPAVLSYWLTALPEAASCDGWQDQYNEILDSVKNGEWWGTITSEPGSGGDVGKTKAIAHSGDSSLQYFLSGQKHFGSGSGMMSFMVTTAIPEGEDKPDWFYIDMREVDLHDATGVQLLAEWDGQGMTATQSHSLDFDRFPATRMAWTGNLPTVALRTGSFIGCLFTSVIVGIVDIAIETAREKIKPNSLGAFEQVEWVRINMEGWLIQQAYEGMLRAVEQQADPRRDVLQGKTAIAELAESVLTRLCKVIGGGTFSRRSPFGFWFEDVRALGFLRPPWGLAYQTLIDGFPGEDESV